MENCNRAMVKPGNLQFKGPFAGKHQYMKDIWFNKETFYKMMNYNNEKLKL